MKHSHTFISAALALMLSFPLGAMAHEMKFGDLVIHHPWSRPSAQAGDMAAGCMKITNNGKADDKLIGVTAEIAKAADLRDAKAATVADGIVIPAGKTVELSLKAQHVEFSGISSMPMAGMEFKGTLTFAKAGTVNIEYEMDEAQ